jgi:hypothetical protein
VLKELQRHQDRRCRRVLRAARAAARLTGNQMRRSAQLTLGSLRRRLSTDDEKGNRDELTAGTQGR